MKPILKLILNVITTGSMLLALSLLSLWAAPIENQHTFPPFIEAGNSLETTSTISFTPVLTIYLPIVQQSGSPPTRTLKIGQVTDISGINDNSFNEAAWEGLQNAKTGFGVEIAFLESQQPMDFEKNIDEFIQQDFDLIVTASWMMHDAIQVKAEDNPDFHFTVVDINYLPTLPNVLQSQFAVDEAAFLAGYLAAGTSKTGKVGTFGGLQIPLVVQNMVGFEQGVIYYNQVHSTTVEVIGWDTEDRYGFFIGNFESFDDGRAYAISFFDEGVDIVFPVADLAGLGSADATQERGMMMIGTDSDWYNTAPEYKKVFLTSVLKHVDQFSYEATKLIVEDTFAGGVFNLDLSNNGVGLADYHDNAGEVSSELQAELDQLKQDLIDGTITTCWAEYQNNQPCQN